VRFKVDAVRSWPPGRLREFAAAAVAAIVVVLFSAGSASANVSFTKAWGWGVSDGMAQFETCRSSCQAGSSGGGAGQLNFPTSVATDSSGDVYVGDQNNHRIDLFSSTGSFLGAAGWGVSDGMAQFETCTSSCQAGSGGSGAGQFSFPSVAVNQSSGDVYVAEIGNDRVQQFSSTGTFIRMWGWGVSDGNSQFETCTSSCQGGISGAGDGQLSFPQSIAIDGSGNVYVADLNQRISEFSATGAFVRVWGWGVADGASHAETCTSSCQAGIAGGGAGQLNYPRGVTADGSGNVFVSDQANARIDEFSSTGGFTKAWGWGVSDGMAQFETCTSTCQAGIQDVGAGQLNNNFGIAVDGSGDVFVADRDNVRVDQFASTGSFTRAWGWGVSDGMSQFEICTSTCQAGVAGGGAGQVNFLHGVAPDSSGHVYVADSSNNRIDQFTILRSTGTSLACMPSVVQVGSASTCTATVTDTDTGTTSTPAGTVSFSSDGSGSFSNSGSCTLSAGSCHVDYTPSAVGSGAHKITASYGGDSTHATSTDNKLVGTIAPPPTSADLKITGSASASSVQTGVAVTYTYSVTNQGPATATGVTFFESLPDDVDVKSVSPAGSCSSSAPVTCNLGSMSSGQSRTVTVTLSPRNAGDFATTANVAGNESDPQPSNNTVKLTVTAKLPPPAPGKRADAQPVSGAVLVKAPGSNAFVPLDGSRGIPVGSLVNATNGRVHLTVAVQHGAKQSGDFYAGEFKFGQSAGKNPLTTLTLAGGNSASCNTAYARSLVAAKRHRRIRRLWGHVKGNFRTKGHHAAATVRGTTWLTEDYCDGTRVAVTHGVVAVSVFATHKTVNVKAGHSYFASAGKH
jgi:uncharacterized repeat protein (TIGR01451 family)